MRTDSHPPKGRAITLNPQAVRVKRRLRAHLKELGFTRGPEGQLLPPGKDKQSIRLVHTAQRTETLQQNKAFLDRHWSTLSDCFADGVEIDPEQVSPRLEVVSSGTRQAALFRLASMSWSVPVSQGFGRRMRFLVWDESNDKLIGLLALGDPVFNLACRDNLIGWNAKERTDRLSSVLDAYTLGAVPPYSKILGGKLVACLVRTKEVQHAFENKYGKYQGLISGKQKSASLAVVTTSSSLGRSSLYNRLRLDGRNIFTSVGFTRGYGHFHIPQDLFTEMRSLLSEAGHKYANGNRFGDGPNWRIRTIRESLKLLEIPEDILKHNIGREVFVSELASNAFAYLRGEALTANFDNLPSVQDVGLLARNRWLIPRASSRRDYLNWHKDMFTELLGLNIQSQEVKRVSS